jgi:hypothetical protein
MALTYYLTPGANQDVTGRVLTNDMQTPAWASTINIVTTQHETDVQPLTTNGDTTLTATVGTQNVGDILRVCIVSDLVSPATTFTITFSTGFKMPTNTFSLTTTKTVFASFYYNGADWVGSGFLTTS